MLVCSLAACLTGLSMLTWLRLCAAGPDRCRWAVGDSPHMAGVCGLLHFVPAVHSWQSTSRMLLDCCFSVKTCSTCRVCILVKYNGSTSYACLLAAAHAAGPRRALRLGICGPWRCAILQPHRPRLLWLRRLHPRHRWGGGVDAYEERLAGWVMRVPGGPSGRHHGFCTCFPKRTCCVPGAAVNGAKFVRDLYEKSGDTFGKYTVPILWDKKKASRCGWLGDEGGRLVRQDALRLVVGETASDLLHKPGVAPCTLAALLAASPLCPLTLCRCWLACAACRAALSTTRAARSCACSMPSSTIWRATRAWTCERRVHARVVRF